MTLSASTLSTELQSMELTNSEATAIAAWALSFKNYMEDAEASSPILTGNLSTAQTAMESAMSGLSTDAKTAIQSGIIAFWGTISASPNLFFTGATAITPPAGLSGLSSTLDTTFTDNKNAGANKSDAMNTIASDINTANSGGTATIGGSPVTIL